MKKYIIILIIVGAVGWGAAFSLAYQYDTLKDSRELHKELYLDCVDTLEIVARMRRGD